MIAPGEHLWHVAEVTAHQARPDGAELAEVAGYHRRLVAANRHRLAVPDNPDLVLPGDVIVRPDWAA